MYAPTSLYSKKFKLYLIFIKVRERGKGEKNKGDEIKGKIKNKKRGKN